MFEGAQEIWKAGKLQGSNIFVLDIKQKHWLYNQCFLEINPFYGSWLSSHKIFFFPHCFVQQAVQIRIAGFFQKSPEVFISVMIQCGLSMMSWLIHTFFVLVDPHPFYCIKMVWIDQNKKGCGLTKTSLTVHAVVFKQKI